MNLELYHDDLPADVTEKADEDQATFETKARGASNHERYTGVLYGQLYGPLQRIVIPFTHSRQSKMPLFHKHGKCTRAARMVDFDALNEIMAGGSVQHEDIPLDILAKAWAADVTA